MTEGEGDLLSIHRGPRVARLTLPRRYWQLHRDQAHIPCHPGRVTKSLFATSSDLPERHEDVISNDGFPRFFRGVAVKIDIG